MGEPAFQLPEEDKPDIRPHLRALEGGGETTPREEGHLKSVGDSEDGSSLEDKEKDSAEDSKSGASAGDKLKNQLWRGQDSDESKKNAWSRMFQGKSRMKKRIAIAAAAAGGSLLGGILIFFLMLPLKIESLVNNLETHFGAASSQALNDESSNLFSAWVRRDIIGNLGKGACHNTVSAGCVSVDPDTGPLGQMFNAWRQGKVEQKLATQNGIIIGKKGGNFYIATPDGTANISAADEAAFKSGRLDIFDVAENDSGFKKTKVSRAELRQLVSTRLEKTTLKGRFYDYFAKGHYMEVKYGVKRCIIACNIRDNFADGVTDKKKFAKSIFVERVIAPLSQNYGFLANCILQGGGGECGTSPDSASPGDEEKTSAGERKVTQVSTDLASKIGTETAAELSKKASAIADEGLQKYLVRSFTSGVVDFLTNKGSGEAAGEAATKAIPVVGWALLIAQFAHGAREIGPMIQYIGYAIKATAAVQTYYVYATAASEMKSGHTDSTEVGTLTSALGSNLSGSTDDRSDATQTPLYQQINGTGSTATAAVAFNGSASAAGATGGRAGSYLCNDGKPPSGVVCSEEDLASGNDVTNKISGFYDSTIGSIPGANTEVTFVNFIGNLPGDFIGKIIKIFHAGALGDLGCHVTPGCQAFKGVMEKYGGEFLTALFNKVIDNPVTDNMSGGRIYDEMAAGADVSQNQSCQVELGCAKVNDQQAASIRGQYLAEQKKQFQNESMFARMFSTSSPYSLVSKVALAMPSSAGSARDQAVASLIHNPLGSIGSIFSSLLSGNRAFAATNTSTKDPFSVPQTAYPSVPKNPDTFWLQNCVNGPLAIYNSTDKTLDVSAWLNGQTQDEASGEAVSEPGNMTKDGTNPCLLLYNSFVINGAKFDPTLIPAADFPNSSTSSDSGVGDFTVASYNLLNAEIHADDSRAVGGCNTQGDPACIKFRSNLQAQFIKGDAGTPQIDILTSQETSPSQFKELTSDLGSGYAAVPDNSDDIKRLTQQQDGATAIIWNTAKFTKVSEGKFDNISNVASTDNQGHITAPYVVLNATGSTQNIYVTSIHYPNEHFVGPGGDDATMRRASNMTMDWVRSVTAKDPDGIVLIGGDFNDNPTDPPNNPRSYCIYTAKGLMQNVYDLQHNNSGQCPSSGSHAGGFGGIDNFYVSQDSGLSAKNYTHVAKQGIFVHASDHTPVYATLSFPDSGSTSQKAGDFAWPLDKKWWTNDRADFLNNHTTISGTFTGTFAGSNGIASDISSPPVGSPEYSMLGGKVIKTNLCGDGDGMIIESKIQGGTLDIAYGHGLSPRFKVGDTVQAGQQILSLNGVGCKVTGPHLHVDMAFNGKHICPQDVFLAMGNGQAPDLASLTAKGVAPCGRQ